MMIVRGQITSTKAVWPLRFLFSNNSCSWKMRLFPEPVGKTASKSFFPYSCFTAFLCSSFKVILRPICSNSSKISFKIYSNLASPSLSSVFHSEMASKTSRSIRSSYQAMTNGDFSFAGERERPNKQWAGCRRFPLPRPTRFARAQLIFPSPFPFLAPATQAMKYGATLREMRFDIQAWIAPSYPYITYLFIT